MNRTLLIAATLLALYAIASIGSAQNRGTKAPTKAPTKSPNNTPAKAPAIAPATSPATAKTAPKSPLDDIPAPDTLPPAVLDPTKPPKELPSPDIAGMTRLAKDMDVWMDVKRKLVVVDGKIAVREGMLEMFACPKGTKEHESLVAVNAKPSFVHAGLLAIGAKTGTPVKFDPAYAPATGPVVEIFILWKDKDGKRQSTRAQEWIRHSKTKKIMEYDWVFAGSGFWVDEDDGTKHYQGDGGDFICVSNFPSATLDLPVQSSQENSGLMFEANTDKMPPRDTKVRLVLIPKIEAKPAATVKPNP
jgi:hypothetical protein